MLPIFEIKSANAKLAMVRQPRFRRFLSGSQIMIISRSEFANTPNMHSANTIGTLLNEYGSAETVGVPFIIQCLFGGLYKRMTTELCIRVVEIFAFLPCEEQNFLNLR